MHLPKDFKPPGVSNRMRFQSTAQMAMHDTGSKVKRNLRTRGRVPLASEQRVGAGAIWGSAALAAVLNLRPISLCWRVPAGHGSGGWRGHGPTTGRKPCPPLPSAWQPFLIASSTVWTRPTLERARSFTSFASGRLALLLAASRRTVSFRRARLVLRAARRPACS